MCKFVNINFVVCGDNLAGGVKTKGIGFNAVKDDKRDFHSVHCFHPPSIKKGVIMTIMRGGKCYEVIDECGDMFAVSVVFHFATFPYIRELKLWWEKKYCTIIKG